MVSVVVGSIIAAIAFTGAQYGGRAIDRAVSGDKKSELAAEAKRHDLAMEDYENRVKAWNMKRQAYQDWLNKNYKDKITADKNFENTDYAFKLYAQTHPHESFTSKKPEFHYTPSNRQKNSELAFLGLSGLAIGAGAAYYI